MSHLDDNNTIAAIDDDSNVNVDNDITAALENNSLLHKKEDLTNVNFTGLRSHVIIFFVCGELERITLGLVQIDF